MKILLIASFLALSSPAQAAWWCPMFNAALKAHGDKWVKDKAKEYGYTADSVEWAKRECRK